MKAMKNDLKRVCVYVWCTPAGPNLKVLSTMSVGFDHISLEEVKKR